ncbi:hypothetical protein ANANG_G00293330 [Anguilla anguilla]|uniref:Uncharacterized protein n=1 Tax=Anguilla anguilla TaxID=7936 RepID=A0A9D3LP85_ANGAN|nr:hypothetical protein ANANG_G00293330 [Anguilla anguilla]
MARDRQCDVAFPGNVSPHHSTITFNCKECSWDESKTVRFRSCIMPCLLTVVPRRRRHKRPCVGDGGVHAARQRSRRTGGRTGSQTTSAGTDGREGGREGGRD